MLNQYISNHFIRRDLFTRCSSRALVLDLVPNCLATTTIRGLRRFFVRRGVPSEIFLDNGTPFTAEETQAFVVSKSIKWRFISSTNETL